MKKIDAIIRLSRFEVIRDALAEIDVRFFTLAEVKGFGLQRGEKLTYRGSVYDADYIARLQLTILCNDEKVDDIVEVICASGRTGKVGDGKITVTSLDRVVRIRTGEENESAI
ncbi:transcriptional regulator [Lewinellaceae bacterium SD302]|nr:transcriptional regulator [Lewinellaceae bacterium SD302]